jgi:hypothetical protein
MNCIRFSAAALGLAAALTTGSVQAQPYGRESFCYYVGGYLRCEERTVGARGYMGDHKWCLYREGTMGETALCSYSSYRACIDGRAMNRGQCVINPNYADNGPPRGRR